MAPIAAASDEHDPGGAATPRPAKAAVAPINLPFRRMSMPVNPISPLFSPESIPEDPSSSSPLPPMDKWKPSSPKRPSRVSRPPSLASPRRLSARDSLVEGLTTGNLTKRWKIVSELHDSERSYLSGLELIYSHFLLPLVESLETKNPILSRAEMNSIFSNFIDIWNFHRSFYSSLEVIANQSPSLRSSQPPHVASVLRSHFPYLSLYTPFVRDFPTCLTTLTNLRSTNPRFAEYLKDKEQQDLCRKLGLQAWLLTIVQRCPRYLLLLRDLVSATPPGEKEHADLVEVVSLVSKITLSIDTSLHTHWQVLSLLALQKAVPNIPFPLVAPGRTLLKRGRLILAHPEARLREVLLFSDCILWLVPPGGDTSWSQQGSQPQVRPPLGLRTRSRSDASLPRLNIVLPATSATPTPSGKEFFFEQSLKLVDAEVVFTSSHSRSEEFGFDLLSPEGSFTFHCSDSNALEDWITAIRAAKASLLIGLSSMQMNTTLTSSASNAHVRKALRALPYASDAENEATLRRGKVDHFLPPVWVPDQRTQNCMRCSKAFTWRRRRHHCRLCGRCVCASCSAKTFYIAEATGKGKSKPARACNLCYEAVFPKLEPDNSNSPDAGPDGAGDDPETLPIWKTTKATHLAVSVLELLGQSVVEDSDEDIHTSSFAHSQSEHTAGDLITHKRLSTPVLAIQETTALAHSRASSRQRTSSLTASSGPVDEPTKNQVIKEPSRRRSIVAEQLHQLLLTNEKE